MQHHKLPFGLHPSFGTLEGFRRPVIGVERRVIQSVLNQYTDSAIIDAPADIAHIMSTIGYNAQVRERDEAETDPSFVHLITYCPIFHTASLSMEDNASENGHWLTEAALHTYQRGKGVGEQRLLGSYSVGIGGHVELDQALLERLQAALALDPTRLSEAFAQQYDPMAQACVQLLGHIQGGAMLREFYEEIAQLQYLEHFDAEHQKSNSLNDDTNLAQLEERLKRHPFGTALMHTVGMLFGSIPDLLIFDQSDEVGRVHLGMVTFVPFVSDGLTGDAIQMAEAELVSVGWQSVQDLIGEPKLESWSKHLVNWMVQVKHADYNQYLNERLQARVAPALQTAQALKIGTNDVVTGTNANIDFKP